MAVVSPYIYSPAGAACYDLRKVVSWRIDVDGVAQVRFVGIGDGTVVVQFADGAAFEAAMQTALDA